MRGGAAGQWPTTFIATPCFDDVVFATHKRHTFTVRQIRVTFDKLPRPPLFRSVRQGHRQERRHGTQTHRRDIAQVYGKGLAPQLAWRHGITQEMHALDQHVGRKGNDIPVTHRHPPYSRRLWPPSRDGRHRRKEPCRKIYESELGHYTTRSILCHKMPLGLVGRRGVELVAHELAFDGIQTEVCLYCPRAYGATRVRHVRTCPPARACPPLDRRRGRERRRATASFTSSTVKRYLYFPSLSMSRFICICSIPIRAIFRQSAISPEGGNVYLLCELHVAEISRRQVCRYERNLQRLGLHAVTAGTDQFEDIGILLVGHDARPRSEGIGQTHESEIGTRIEAHVLREASRP